MKTRKIYTVRLVRTDDINAFFRLINKNRLYLERFFSGELDFTRTREDTIVYLTHNVCEAERRNQFLFVIEEHGTENLIGSVQVKDLDTQKRKAEIGFYLDRSCKRKNVLARAVGEVVEFCFLSLIPGRHVAETNGFLSDGITYIHLQGKGDQVSHSLQYSLVNPAIQ
jgi:RimJ/RimL family protein N-acetyltransferase